MSTLLCCEVVTITTQILSAVIGPQTRGEKRSHEWARARAKGWLIPLTRCFLRFYRECENVGIYIYIYIQRLHLSYTRAWTKHVRDTQRRGYTSHHLSDSLILAPRSSSLADRQLPKAFVKVHAWQEERVTARVVPDPVWFRNVI